jgi:hypothetical protein
LCWRFLVLANSVLAEKDATKYLLASIVLAAGDFSCWRWRISAGCWLIRSCFSF